jgi:hypothetical protein
MSDAEGPIPESPPQDRVVPALGVLGAAVLVVGVFAPAVPGPDGAPLSYRGHAAVDGNVVLVLAVVSFALTWVFRWYRGLWLTGLGALAMVAGTFFKLQRSPAAGQAGWAWLALVGGAGLLLAAALVAESRRPREEEPPDSEVV